MLQNLIWIRSTKKTGFDGHKLSERTECITWDASLNHKFPPLAGFEHWYLNKWTENGDLWRAWLIKFCIFWNSHNGTVHIGFEYRTQHYVHDIWELWVEN